MIMAGPRRSVLGRTLIDFFRRPLIFLVSGGINTIFTVAIYWLLLLIVNYVIAYLVAFAAGIILSNALHSRFVFDVPVRAGKIIPVGLWYAVSAVLGAAFLAVLVRQHILSRELAILAVALVLAPLNYVAMKLILLPGR